MTRRRVLCGVLLLSAVLACFAAWLWIESRPRGMRKQFEWVEEGMTPEQVIRTVGVPPGDYSRGVSGTGGKMFSPLNYKVWLSDDAEMIVIFHRGKVVMICLFPVEPLTFTQRIRRQLGL